MKRGKRNKTFWLTYLENHRSQDANLPTNLQLHQKAMKARRRKMEFDAEEFSARDQETEEKRSAPPLDDTVAFSNLMNQMTAEYKMQIDKPKQRKVIIYDVFETKTETSTTAFPTDADILE